MRTPLGVFPLLFLVGCTASSGGGGGGGDDADTDVDTDADTDSDLDPCDRDGDGSRAESCGGDDCDDEDSAVHPGAADTEVLTETVDNASRTGWYTSIGTGPGGVVHVSYDDITRQDLRVATLRDGVWTNESPDTQGTFGAYTTLAVGADGAVHVAYGDEATQEARYATNSGGAWQIETIATNAAPLPGRGIAIDGDGVVHVLYVAIGSPEIGHAARLGGEWTIETVEARSTGRGALAIDSSGNLHVAYGSSNRATYATNASGAWTTRSLTGIDEQTSNVGITVDPDGVAHVVYWDFDSQSIRVRSSPGFEVADVYPAFGEADSLSVASDEHGGLHVCVPSETTEGGVTLANLVYLTNARGPWEFVVLDEGTTGYYCSIAARDGAVHVSYFDSERGILRYATLGVPDDVDSDCDGEAEGPPLTPTSGLDPDRTLGDLSEGDWRAFCEWSAALQGGEGTIHECPDGSTTVGTVAECVEDSAAFEDCALPVSDAEACIRAIAADPCDGFRDPACAAMFACAM